jgi:class 3 adenylate cyclase
MTNEEGRDIRRGTALIVDVVSFYGQEPRSLEATAAVLDDLYTTIADAVIPHEGVVIKWLGDGALICFWGEQHERDAVEAAVALQAGFAVFGERNGFERSGLTISIATGQMIAGLFGDGPARHYDVWGEPVTCTATIMPEASGAITLCEATYKAVADRVEATPLTEHEYFGALYALKRLK